MMKVARHEYISTIQSLKLSRKRGRLTAIHGLIIEASGCDVHQGELVEIIHSKDNKKVMAEVVGLRDDRILLMPFSSVQGLSLNSIVVPLNKFLRIPVGEALLGRVIDPLGNALDSGEKISYEKTLSSHSDPINPLHRTPITTRLETGVKAIDIFCPLGRGQRIGIFAGSGVGKSTLLGMIAQNSNADVIVIGLIGERGREVGDFIRNSLGESGLSRSVVVAAAAEQTAVIRRQAAFSATSIAEYFRARGKNVLLIMDSITRLAMAQREIGLSIGESVGSRGYPPSVFALLPPLLERSGTLENQGSITSIYTVLVEGDDLNEPISDHMRSILDGHIVLSRELASSGHFPAIDIQTSISRLANVLLEEKEKQTIKTIKRYYSLYVDAKDLVDLGAYEVGRNLELDRTIKIKPKLFEFLSQSPEEDREAGAPWNIVANLAQELSGEVRGAYE